MPTFYDSAEGLLTAMLLLVAEYLPTEDAEGKPIEERHIVSVFKLVQELLAPSGVKGKNQFQLLLESSRLIIRPAGLPGPPSTRQSRP